MAEDMKLCAWGCGGQAVEGKDLCLSCQHRLEMLDTPPVDQMVRRGQLIKRQEGKAKYGVEETGNA